MRMIRIHSATTFDKRTKHKHRVIILRKQAENNNKINSLSFNINDLKTKKMKFKALIYKDKFMVKNADYAFNINGLQLPWFDLYANLRYNRDTI